MAAQIEYDDPKYAAAAAEILRRYDDSRAEANITSAVRDFLVVTGLVEASEIVEEDPPAQGSRRAVDLTALDTFIEFKRRIGMTGGFNPNPDYVEQLDDYLAQALGQGRMCMGILTDGKHWLLRSHNPTSVKTTPSDTFTLEDPDRWILLYEWLRDKALFTAEKVVPDRERIGNHFGPDSPVYERDIAELKTLYGQCADFNTIRVKRRLWQGLLMAALGEIAGDSAEMDDLFVRHTYLSAVIGMAVQASFGSDIHWMAEIDPADLLHGRGFRSKTGLQGVVESDFFAWPTEVEGGLPLLKTLARRVARFDWMEAPTDVASILYETVIPPDERRQLGEYYTPDWLARAIVREVVTRPLDQRVLDPACGSGTFVAEAVTHFIEAANAASLAPQEALERLRSSVTGIDIHPVAVHLARAAWVLAARPAIQAAVEYGFAANITAPIYLGDALQLRFRTGDMIARHYVTVQVEDEQNTELAFPVSLVERAETFDALMGDIAEAIERGEDSHLALDDHHIAEPEQKTLKETIKTLQRLHKEGRNHIWAYYTRNLVRPVALSNSKVDAIIGNPPWLNYNQTISILRTELERQSRDVYGIWSKGKYTTHQDVAGLFFARSVDLYLKDGGVIGMVMPHSALQTGQHARWRTGRWQAKSSGKGKKKVVGRVLAVNFGYKTAWDLEGLEPNTFFPIPASVAFARRTGEGAQATPLAGKVERWLGKAGAASPRRVSASITDTSVRGDSPYADHSLQGAVVVPRCLFFVEETENPAIVRPGQTATVNPRRGPQDKEPWSGLDLTAITSQTIESNHVYDVHLGETVVPYATLDPLKAVLPLRSGDRAIPAAEKKKGVGGIRLGGLEKRMRERWRTTSGLWEKNRAKANKLNLLGQLDYYGKLSAQLAWQRNPGDRPVRVVYTSAGQPTAALLHDDDSIVDYKLFWIACKDAQEAHYLLAIINSDMLCTNR